MTGRIVVFLQAGPASAAGRRPGPGDPRRGVARTPRDEAPETFVETARGSLERCP